LDLFPDIVFSGISAIGQLEPTELRKRLVDMGGGCYATAHLPFSPERAEVLGDLGVNSAVIVRDPRDVAVSHFHFLTYKRRRHRLHPYFESLPNDSERLMASICGVDPRLEGTNGGLDNIGKRFHNGVAWADYGSCIVRFESLIGPRGGGSRELQVEEIRKLSAHFGLDLGDKDVDCIADQVFHPKSQTFRKGLIGDWKNHFTPEHKAALKEVAGQLLIDLGYETTLDW
jgi:hypothetical protein